MSYKIFDVLFFTIFGSIGGYVFGTICRLLLGEFDGSVGHWVLLVSGVVVVFLSVKALHSALFAEESEPSGE